MAANVLPLINQFPLYFDTGAPIRDRLEIAETRLAQLDRQLAPVQRWLDAQARGYPPGGNFETNVPTGNMEIRDVQSKPIPGNRELPVNVPRIVTYAADMEEFGSFQKREIVGSDAPGVVNTLKSNPYIGDVLRRAKQAYVNQLPRGRNRRNPWPANMELTVSICPTPLGEQPNPYLQYFNYFMHGWAHRDVPNIDRYGTVNVPVSTGIFDAFNMHDPRYAEHWIPLNGFLTKGAHLHTASYQRDGTMFLESSNDFQFYPANFELPSMATFVSFLEQGDYYAGNTGMPRRAHISVFLGYPAPNLTGGLMGALRWLDATPGFNMPPEERRFLHMVATLYRRGGIAE